MKVGIVKYIYKGKNMETSLGASSDDYDDCKFIEQLKTFPEVWDDKPGAIITSVTIHYQWPPV